MSRVIRPTEGAAERGCLAQAVQAQADGVPLALALLLHAFGPQDERQALGAARHAARQRRGQDVHQVLPHASQDEAREDGPWRRTQAGMCFTLMLGKLLGAAAPKKDGRCGFTFCHCNNEAEGCHLVTGCC